MNTFSPFEASFSSLARFSLVLLVFKNSTEILNTDYFYLSGFYEWKVERKAEELGP